MEWIIKENDQITEYSEGNEENKFSDFYIRNVKIIDDGIKSLDENELNQLFLMLQKANNLNDFSRIVNLFINIVIEKRKMLNGYEIKSLRKKLKENPEIIIATFVKKFINYYFLKKFYTLTEDEIIDMNNKKIKTNSYKPVFELLDIKFDENAYNNGIYDVSCDVAGEKLNKFFEKASHHLCFNCSNGYPSACEKVFDFPNKKPISDYPFITSGYQIFNNGYLKTFTVTKCKNFKIDNPKKNHC